MNSREIKQLVDHMHETVRSDDPRMRQSVMITHEDGSTLFFRYAFMVRCHNWLLVFSEHQGSHYFAMNDLASCYHMFETVMGPLDVVDDYTGQIITKLNCSYCKNEMASAEINSIYDEMGNRIDADICEGCAELYHHNQKEPEPDLLDCE